jgi:hypothetical protein
LAEGSQSRIDPYTRAHHLSYGLVPSNRFDTVEYEARVDDAGRSLDGDCTYLVSGPMPRARWWSLSALSSARSGGNRKRAAPRAREPATRL